MDPISTLALTSAVQGVSNVVEDAAQAISTQVSGGFDAVMRSMLPDQADSINEEELFAALIAERLGVHSNQASSDSYKELLQEKKSSLARADGYVPVEQAANEALDAMVTNGDITAEMAQTIKQEAFAAAQLDDNKTALYDGRGDAGDPTIAVMNMEAALIQAQQMIDNIDSGDTSSLTTSDDTTTDTTSPSNDSTTPTGNEVDGAGSGFLFKPESEHGNQLVVLLPAQLANEVEEIVLKDDQGEVIERGVSSGYANPDSVGDREHFRFTKPGSEYPQNITVEVKLADGSIKEYQIPDPSQRYD